MGINLVGKNRKAEKGIKSLSSEAVVLVSGSCGTIPSSLVQVGSMIEENRIQTEGQALRAHNASFICKDAKMCKNRRLFPVPLLPRNLTDDL